MAINKISTSVPPPGYKRKSMRVAIMALNFASGKPDSHEHHLPHLVKALINLCDDTTYVLLLRSDNQQSFPPPGPRVKHIVFPRLCRYKIVQIFCEQVIVPLLLAVLRADLVHFHTNFRPYFVPCRSVGSVHWVSTRLLRNAYSWPKRIYFCWSERLSFAKADRLLAVSETCKAGLVQNGVPAEKVKAVPHGIVSERFTRREPDSEFLSRYGLRCGYLLYVGTSDPYKNLNRLLEAYTLARMEYGIIDQLVLAGKIDREIITGFVEHVQHESKNCECLDDIICTGYIPYDDMPLLYAGASIAVSASMQETFGIAILEAMAAEVPLVVSDIPAHREVTAGAAILVDPQNSREIATAIATVLRTPELRDDLTRAGLARVSNYSWDSAARKALSVYQTALAFPD